MNKLYFKSIELPEENKDRKPADDTIENWPTKEQFDLINDKIIIEINNIEQGTSRLTGYPTTPTKSFMSVFKRFRENPTHTNYKSFLILVEQDLGTKALSYFEKLFNIIFDGRVSK
jgi:hypothetical protein